MHDDEVKEAGTGAAAWSAVTMMAALAGRACTGRLLRWEAPVRSGKDKPTKKRRARNKRASAARKRNRHG